MAYRYDTNTQGVASNRGHYDRPEAGLGALTRGGITIDYYPASALSFRDANLKKLHDKIVDFDFMWQSNLIKLASVAGAVAPLVSGGSIKAEDIQAAGKIPCPLAGTALILELAVGGRPLDQSAIAICRLLGNTLIAEAALFGVVGTVCGSLAAAAVFGTGGAVGAALAAIAPSLLPAAAAMGSASAVAGLVGGILLGLTEGKLPNRGVFGQTMKMAAATQNPPLPIPTEASIDTAYNDLNAALEAGEKTLAASSVTASADWVGKVASTEKALAKLPGAPTSVAALHSAAVRAVEKKFGKQPKVLTVSSAPGTNVSKRRPVASSSVSSTQVAALAAVALVAGYLVIKKK